MNNWEVCPLCKGQGVVHSTLTQNAVSCTVCEGGKIINSFTGLPKSRPAVKKENVNIMKISREDLERKIINEYSNKDSDPFATTTKYDYQRENDGC